MKLLNVDENSKTVKGQKYGYLTGIMYLAPERLSGYNVCPMATAGCKHACLNTAGRAQFSNVQKSRIKKTKWYFEDRFTFLSQLVREICNLEKLAKKKGLTPVVRLNGTSDITWENVEVPTHRKTIMQLFPHIQFYDYTKRHNRKNLPANYHLTYSLAENNDALAYDALKNGVNVAAVFRNPEMVQKAIKAGFTLNGKKIKVVDGDENDLRFNDKAPLIQRMRKFLGLRNTGVIVALYAKGKARKDKSGFVREV